MVSAKYCISQGKKEERMDLKNHDGFIEMGRRAALFFLLVDITYLISTIYLTSMFKFLFTPENHSKNHSIKAIAENLVEEVVQHVAHDFRPIMIALTILLVPGK